VSELALGEITALSILQPDKETADLGKAVASVGSVGVVVRRCG
jgi:hypothetical protein